MDLKIIYRYTLKGVLRRKAALFFFRDIGRQSWLVGAGIEGRKGLGCTLQELSMLVKCRLRQTLSTGISDTFRACAFDKFHESVWNHGTQEMYSYVHVTRVFAICGVLSHEDARRVILSSQISVGPCCKHANLLRSATH
jgi:hypothetical protein